MSQTSSLQIPLSVLQEQGTRRRDLPLTSFSHMSLPLRQRLLLAQPYPLEFVRGAAWCGLLECDALLAAGGHLVPGNPAVWGAGGKRNHWCLLWRLQEEGGRMAWSRAVEGNFLLPGCVLTFSLPQHAAH